MQICGEAVGSVVQLPKGSFWSESVGSGIGLCARWSWMQAGVLASGAMKGTRGALAEIPESRSSCYNSKSLAL